jgi:tetratricopeptide (TPR) repeat protein
MWRSFTRIPAMMICLLVAACSGMPQMGGQADTDIDAQAVSPVAQRDYAEITALLDAGELADATARLERFIARHAEFPGAYTTLAIVYAEQGRVEDAFKSIDIALSINPRFAPAQNQLGVLKRREGDFAAAEQAWKAAIAADPQYPYAWHNLGVLYDLYLPDLPAALEHYQQYQALAIGETGQTERWIADLQRRIDTQPRAALNDEVTP